MSLPYPSVAIDLLLKSHGVLRQRQPAHLRNLIVVYGIPGDLVPIRLKKRGFALEDLILAAPPLVVVVDQQD